MKIKYGNYSTLSKKLKEKHDKQSKQLSKINENYVSKLNNDDLKILLDKLLFCQILSLRITRNLFIQKMEFINETLKARGIDLKKIAEEKDKKEFIKQFHINKPKKNYTILDAINGLYFSTNDK